MTPAETLRAAATKLRETAVPISHFPTPWAVERGENDEWHVLYEMNNPLAGLIATTPDYGRIWLADWIALMSPALAEPLAAWLDGTAEVHQEHDADGSSWCRYCAERWPCGDFKNARTVAVAILGEAP